MFQDFIKKGVIDPIELKSILGNPSVRFLDASYALPNSGINPQKNFEKKRIRDSQFFDISVVSDKKSSLPHMLPSSEEFEQAVAKLGIKNNDLVVIYGQGDMAMGPARAWWMFRVFGHDNVLVLDGGLPAWIAVGGELETTPAQTPSPSTYKVTQYRQEMVCDLDKVANSQCPILDARPKARFDGAQAEPRAGLRSGHIPAALIFRQEHWLILKQGK